MVRWLFKAANNTSTGWRILTQKIMMPAPFFMVTVFALVFGLLSFVELPCPTCGGTGVLTSVAGLKAQVVASDMINSNIPLTCCDHPQVQYIYEVILSIQNTASNSASGIVTVSFYDIEPALSSSDEVNPAAVGVFPIQVEVPGGKTITVDQQLSFIDTADIINQPHKVTVQSGDTETKNVCPLCNGKGKLQFYAWLEAHVK